MDSISREFAERAVSVWGDAGRFWLARLPDLLSQCERHWAIRITSFLPDPYNPIPGLLAMSSPRRITQRRLDTLAAILGEDRARLAGWALFDAVLSACWSLEEGSGGWEHAIACADILDGLVV